MKAVGYTRLSQQSDTSIDNQAGNIKQYATDMGFDLVDILSDGEQSSGFKTDREAYQSLLQMMHDGSVDAVIANDNQRLARDPNEAMEVILAFRTCDIEYHTCINGQISLAEPMDVIVAMIQAVVPALAKLEEIKKSKQAIEKRQDQGYYQGGIPFGLRMNKETKLLEKDPVEWRKCEFIWRSGEYDNTTEWRILKRGREYYEELLEEYGTSSE